MTSSQIKTILSDFNFEMNTLIRTNKIRMIITDLENPIFVDTNTRLNFIDIDDGGLLEVYYGEEKNGKFNPFALGPSMSIPFVNIYGFETNRQPLKTKSFWSGRSGAVPTPNKNNIIEITTAEELAAIAVLTNEGTNFNKQKFELMADIDLQGILWTPIGTSSNHKAGSFRGIFNGNGHIISNLKVSSEAATGLFGYLSGTVENLTIKNVSVSTNHHGGVLAGWAQAVDSQVINHCYIRNVNIINATVTSTYKNDDVDGDKAGALIGYACRMKIENCSASNSTISAARDAGQLVGCIASGSSMKNCSASNVSVIDNNGTQNLENNDNIRNELFGRDTR